MARIWKWEVNPDVKSYLRYFSRGILVVLIILAVLVLIGVSFFYGDRQREDDKSGVSQTQTSEDQDQEASQTRGEEVADQPSDDGSPTSADDQETATTSNDQEVATADETTSTPVTGAQEIPNTGPRENAAIAATALLLLAVKYRKSRRQLQNQLYIR